MIPAALGLVGQVVGQVAAGKENAKADATREAARKKSDKWYALDSAQSEIGRTDAQEIINRQQKVFEDANRRARATNVVAGGTDESLAMQKAQGANAVAQTYASIAANASERQDKRDAAYRERDASFDNAEIAAARARAEQATKAAEGIAKAGGALAGTLMQKDNYIQKSAA